MLKDDTLSFIKKSQYDGSDLYYSLLYQDRESKELLSLLFAFEYELIEITTQINDPGIARQKLNWWREELIRLRNKEARHPLSKALSHHVNNKNIIDDLLNILVYSEELLMPHTFTSCRDFQECYNNNFGRLWVLSTELIGIDDFKDIAVIGMSHYYLYTLQQHEFMQQQARQVIPDKHSMYDSYATMINVLETVNIPDSHTTLRYARTMHTLMLLHCKTALRKKDDDFIGITPLRKLMHAWLISLK